MKKNAEVRLFTKATVLSELPLAQKSLADLGLCWERSQAEVEGACSPSKPTVALRGPHLSHGMLPQIQSHPCNISVCWPCRFFSRRAVEFVLSSQCLVLVMVQAATCLWWQEVGRELYFWGGGYCLCFISSPEILFPLIQTDAFSQLFWELVSGGWGWFCCG